jgi:EF hand
LRARAGNCLQWFDAIDRDRSGTLDASELQRALALGNLHFSLQAVAHMIRFVTASLTVATAADSCVQPEAPVITEPIGHRRSYLVCGIGHSVPIWQPYIGSSLRQIRASGLRPCIPACRHLYLMWVGLPQYLSIRLIYL